MTHKNIQTNRQPTIVRLVQNQYNGIQSMQYSRYSIGFVLRGRKYIHNGDIRHEAVAGDMFYLSTGNHYMENIPEDGKPFEQIVFYYTPQQLSRILVHLSLDHGFNVSNNHSCPNCYEKNYVIYPTWSTIRSFFITANQYMKEGVFAEDDIAETLKITELIYLLTTQPDCCIKSKLLDTSDTDRENFEQIIYRNVFKEKSIDDLARECNRSLTSFKNEFKKHFFDPPHRWFIKQRLMQSRLLLISSDKSVSEIGAECMFPNTSHFIKLFRKEYDMTPAAYRKRHSDMKTKERLRDPATVRQ